MAAAVQRALRVVETPAAQQLASFVSSRCDVLSLQASRTASFLARPGMKEIVRVKVVGKRATVGRPILQAGTHVICARTMSYVPVTASLQARLGRQSSPI